MDRGKKSSKIVGARNNKIYMDFKDIIRENALPCLPAKALFKFQGVCKDWKLQISTPFFAHKQSLSFRGTSGFFLQSRGDPPSFVSIDPESCGVPDPSLKFLPVPVDVKSSSNGLLCCQGRGGDGAYYICNPVTKQWKKLPKPNANHGSDPAVALVFQPSLLNFVADYKLICAFRSNDFDDATEFEIYHSKEDSWKISREITFSVWNFVPTPGVNVNGVVYWQSQEGTILGFDLTKDRSQVFQEYSGVKGCLGIMEGKLCKAYVFGHALTFLVLSNIHFNTMQLGKDRMWDEKHHFSLGSEVVGGSTLVQSPVLFAEGHVVLVQSGRAIHSVDLKTKETKELCTVSKAEVRCVPYVNSLVAL